MRSFLVKDKTPIIKWGLLKDNTYFEGDIPDGFKLAISPSKGYIVLDVDINEEKNKNGFDNIPSNILWELEKTLNYHTKRKGKHYWLYYTGKAELLNKTSNLGIDLRTHKGYAVWYRNEDIRDYIPFIQKTSEELNEWLNSLFS